MLGKRAGEKRCGGEECCREVLESIVVEKCWRRGLERSAVEKCCREVL